MSQVVSMRFQESQMERLRRLARRMGRTPSEISAILVEEALRQSEFGYIEFRDSPVGRQAYIQGTRLAVWQVLQIARDYDMDPQQTARHLRWPVHKVQAALQYATAFPDEVEAALQDNAAYDFETLRRMLPQAERFLVTEDA